MIRKIQYLFLALVLGVVISSCGIAADDAPVSYQSTSVSDSSSEDGAQITFWAYLPASISPEETVNLVIQDEVTGLPYNQTRVEMASFGEGLYGVMINFNLDTVVKYYYERNLNGSQIPETDLNNGEVRYRMYLVRDPGETHDLIAGWADAPNSSTTAGRIDGFVEDRNTGLRLADVLITAGGLQTLSDGSGRFTLYPLKPGKHTLVAYPIDGSYKVFQQEAVVAADASTPSELFLEPSSWVEVSFIVSAPESTIDGAPMRMTGNLVQLGNTFSNLGAGVSGDINQMPLMTSNGAGYYSLKIRLPAETEILYKYTLGDGFWNAEHDPKGNYFTRRLVLPSDGEPVVIQDEIATWKTSQTADIWFSVTAPETTPNDDVVSIQFQLANWMPGLPMYSVGDNEWVYPLISPQNFAGPIAYRYCRNGQCSGSYQPGNESSGPGRETITQFSETNLENDEILYWSQIEQIQPAITAPEDVEQRDDQFLTGIAFSPYYFPSWNEFIDQSLLDVRGTNAAQVIFSPSWVAVGPRLPVLFSPRIESSPRWHETAHNLETAHDLGLKTGLFPQMRFSSTATQWWQAADTTDENWWLAWFEQYRKFILQYADLAEKTETETLVLGGDWLLPSLPIADNLENYHLPGNVESLWLAIIEDIRERYHGKLAWHIPVSMLEHAPKSVLADVDQVYLQWDAPLTTQSGASIESMTSQATVLMELYIQPFYDEVGKPVIISLAYPSAAGSDLSCIPTSLQDPTCLDPTPLLQGPVANLQPKVDLQVQADLYTAVMAAIEYQDWVAGVISQGWYPPMESHDPSASAHGKPAQDVLTEWFRLFLGN
ncbi:MAG: hypothetical protein ABFS17_05240 [Chloroflexota bacterium]